MFNQFLRKDHFIGVVLNTGELWVLILGSIGQISVIGLEYFSFIICSLRKHYLMKNKLYCGILIVFIHVLPRFCYCYLHRSAAVVIVYYCIVADFERITCDTGLIKLIFDKRAVIIEFRKHYRLDIVFRVGSKGNVLVIYLFFGFVFNIITGIYFRIHCGDIIVFCSKIRLENVFGIALIDLCLAYLSIKISGVRRKDLITRIIENISVGIFLIFISSVKLYLCNGIMLVLQSIKNILPYLFSCHYNFTGYFIGKCTAARNKSFSQCGFLMISEV